MIQKTIALVTGANRGIGKEVSRQLANRGVDVFLGSRDLGRGLRASEDLAASGAKVTPIQIDVANSESVAAAFGQLHDIAGQLDILVNNAGKFIAMLPLVTTAAQMHHIFEVNVFGVVSVTRTFLPLLRRSPTPRIVNVSSTTGSLTLSSMDAAIPGVASHRMAYSCSKASLNMLTLQYAKAFRDDPGLSHIKINAASPGYTATDMNTFAGDRSVVEGARIIVHLALLPDDGPSGCFFSDSGAVPW